VEAEIGRRRPNVPQTEAEGVVVHTAAPAAYATLCAEVTEGELIPKALPEDRIEPE
jgi:hypothetical protein